MFDLEKLDVGPVPDTKARKARHVSLTPEQGTEPDHQGLSPQKAADLDRMRVRQDADEGDGAEKLEDLTVRSEGLRGAEILDLRDEVVKKRENRGEG